MKKRVVLSCVLASSLFLFGFSSAFANLAVAFINHSANYTMAVSYKLCNMDGGVSCKDIGTTDPIKPGDQYSVSIPVKPGSLTQVFATSVVLTDSSSTSYKKDFKTNDSGLSPCQSYGNDALSFNVDNQKDVTCVRAAVTK